MVENEDDLCFRSASELAFLIAYRHLSATELLTAHLDRVARINPTVNAIVNLVPEQAMERAREIDRRIARNQPVGPLAGLPIAHKDTHETAGITTTYGSTLFEGHLPRRDELIIERLRGADAVSFGKTNVPEFASGSHTFNEVFGPTRNPYCCDRSAGGSSGGAAAALAAGLQPIADGSDMGGSLRNPASFCNVVGLRPSPGRVPSYPTSWPWSTLAVQGPMARSVSDVSLLLSVMAGYDARSPIALSEDPSSFAHSLTGDLRNVRIAWTPDFNRMVDIDPDVHETLVNQLKVFEELGGTVSEACPDLSGANESFRILRAWQFMHSFGDLLQRGRSQLKQSFVQNIEDGYTLSVADITWAEATRRRIFHRTREFFETYDVLLAPVSQVPPFPIEHEFPETVDGKPQSHYLDWMSSAYIISLTGSPALSVPAGFTPGGLPVGLQIIGAHLQDLRVLDAGYAFEQATNFGAYRPRLEADPKY